MMISLSMLPYAHSRLFIVEQPFHSCTFLVFRKQPWFFRMAVYPLLVSGASAIPANDSNSSLAFLEFYIRRTIHHSIRDLSYSPD